MAGTLATGSERASISTTRFMSNSSSSSDTNLVNRASRRDFLRASALGLSLPIATGALAACSTGEAETAAGQANAAHAGGTHAAAPAAPAVKTPESIRAKADEMDAMHEKGIKSFPAPTEGKGNQPLAPRLENGVKVFDLETSIIQWEVEPGRRVEAWAYNGQVPGPQIRVREGDRVRINLRNGLEESTAIHFHGLEVPNDQDGVPFITQPPVKPGESYTYEFVVPNSGSHMYHSHHNSAKQVGLGLLGAFIVEPRQPRAIEKVDVDYTMILNDGYHGFTLNGKGFPATEPIVAKRGQKVRIRYMNEGMMIHPMHLHGMHMTVIDKDGWPQPQPWKCDTINIAPGERWDVIVEANNPGSWAFHCHILTHAETEHGMFGMVTVMVVE
jgi:FtsP/CotA-like multicopper oxidase with cupredoxin domain